MLPDLLQSSEELRRWRQSGDSSCVRSQNSGEIPLAELVPGGDANAIARAGENSVMPTSPDVMPPVRALSSGQWECRQQAPAAGAAA